MQLELMDDIKLSGAELAQNLKELELTNRWFGSEILLINSLQQVYERYGTALKAHSAQLVDLACGSGDLLRVMARWSQAHHIPLSLTGIDINDFMIDFARKRASGFSAIQFKVLDAFSKEFSQQQYDIVTMNSFCHHLTDDSLVNLLKQLKHQTRYAIIINDLQRHAVSFYAIKWITQLFHFSKIAQHDGPLSVLRAFHKRELLNLLKQAGIDQFKISWHFAFRWQIIIWCI
jgi:2-polyprenyl-3-methyl-5-hydroxy-6-metoxy-1,4-benzoquinol methylase